MREDKHEAAIGSWTQAAASFLTNHPGGWSTPVPSKVEFPEKNQYVIREDRSVVITGAPQEKGVVRLHIPLSDAPIRSIRSIRFEALPDDANAGKVGCDKDGRFEVKPASRIKGEDKDLKIAWAQADRRRVKKFVFRIA